MSAAARNANISRKNYLAGIYSNLNLMSPTECHLLNVNGKAIPQYCSGDEIKKNEMGGACSTYGREERCIQSFSGET